MNIDERIGALTMNLELLAHTAEQLVQVTNRDAEALNALARLAEAHEARLSRLEGRQQ